MVPLRTFVTPALHIRRQGSSLPLAWTPIPNPQSRIPAVMPRSLLVEDETAIADTVLYALRAEGHDVSHCATAGDALRQASAERFELAILDVGLPDIGGFALC